MLEFIARNIGTIAVSILLLAVVLAIVTVTVRNKKHGKNSCGCGCSSCAMSELCHKRTEDGKKQNESK